MKKISKTYLKDEILERVIILKFCNAYLYMRCIILYVQYMHSMYL